MRVQNLLKMRVKKRFSPYNESLRPTKNQK